MHLENEIHEQPQALKRLIHGQRDAVEKIAAAIAAFDPVFVSIAARGTSDNAARYAQYLFGAHLGLPVALATPSLHTIYEAPPRLGRALVIGISQSGKAEDVRQVLQDARDQGALTLSITNYADSPMAQTAHHHIELMAGEELSVAATKTYTAQLTAIAMLAAALKDGESLSRELGRLPDYAKEALATSEIISGWAGRYRYMTQFTALGRGYNYCTAFEISLKVKELCSIATVGYSEADFRHGPIAMISPGFPAMVVAPEGRSLPRMLDLLKQLAERKAESLVISNNDEALAAGRYSMRIPKDIPEWLSPVVTIIPGQLFAMQQAIIRDITVDKPHGLTKVTITK